MFIDADKGNYLNYYEAALPLLSPRGLIAVDNVLWSGEVLDPKSDDGHAIVAFNQHVRNDPRVVLRDADGAGRDDVDPAGVTADLTPAFGHPSPRRGEGVVMGRCAAVGRRRMSDDLGMVRAGKPRLIWLAG